MSHPPKQSDPDNLRLSEFVEAIYPMKFISDDVIAVMHPKPIVEGRLSSRPGNLDVLLEANASGFGRQADVAIHNLRPEPDPIDHATGRKFRSH